nr:MBL fold metallo-hydrolase [Haladaptatus halobius]
MVSEDYLYPVENGKNEDIYYLDLGMYDAPKFGAAFIVDADQPAIIETGVGRRYERILAALDFIGIKRSDVSVISPTHVHLDHAGGAGYLAEECPNATILTHEAGVKHLVNPSRLVEGTKRAVGDQWQFYAEPKPIPKHRIKGLSDGDTIDLGNHQLSVYHAPGHAHHQAIYHDETADALFVADAAGIYVPQKDVVKPTTPPPEFNLEQALDDIERIRRIDPEMLFYTHFGSRADVSNALDEYERVLSDWVDTVAAIREEQASDDGVVDYFAERAELIDVWGEQKARPETRMNTQGVLQYLD